MKKRLNPIQGFIDENLFSMVVGYIGAIFFTEKGADTGITDDSVISLELMGKIESDCQIFLTECWKYGFLYSDFDAQLLGHNFWLNRNGHGSGFWDSEDVYGAEFAKKLSELSKTYHEFYVYVGDDKYLYGTK